jgi:hypothetical protein
MPGSLMHHVHARDVIESSAGKVHYRGNNGIEYTRVLGIGVGNSEGGMLGGGSLGRDVHSVDVFFGVSQSLAGAVLPQPTSALLASDGERFEFEGARAITESAPCLWPYPGTCRNSCSCGAQRSRGDIYRGGKHR